MREQLLLKNVSTLQDDVSKLKTNKLDTSSHSWNNLLNKPASLPANGGNADTVDGMHSHQLATLSASGTSHGTSYPLYCKHNVHGDGRFKLMLDTHQTRVDYATSADSATNADTVDGLHAASFLQNNKQNVITYNSGVTDHASLGYGYSNLELRATSTSGTPMLSFHSQGATAVGLYEEGCRLYTTGSDGRREKRLLDIDDYAVLESKSGGGGDINGKTYILAGYALNYKSQTWTYNNSSGGVMYITLNSSDPGSSMFRLTVDGTDIISRSTIRIGIYLGGIYILIVPFVSTVSIYCSDGDVSGHAHIYLNK